MVFDVTLDFSLHTRLTQRHCTISNDSVHILFLESLAPVIHCTIARRYKRVPFPYHYTILHCGDPCISIMGSVPVYS